MLLLTNDDVEQVLMMADCVDVLRRFFEEEGKGQVLTCQRTESWLPHLTTDTFYQCKTMEGGVRYIGKYVIRVDSNVTRKKQQGLQFRESNDGLIPYRPTYIYDVKEIAQPQFPLRSISFGPHSIPVARLLHLTYSYFTPQAINIL